MSDISKLNILLLRNITYFSEIVIKSILMNVIRTCAPKVWIQMTFKETMTQFRGRSQTTLTDFWPFFNPLPLVDSFFKETL